MIVESATNLKWANAEHTAIDMNVKFIHIDEIFPFTATPHDSEAHGRALYAAALSGQYGPINP